MRIEVSSRHMDLTESIKAQVVSKAERLPKYYDGVQEIDIVLEQISSNSFGVEIRVDSEKHDTFVAKADGTDLYGCLDACIDKMTRQLTDFKEKLKNTKR
ncbi:MAG: ribosome hibernation-promoting factor, HPF/YfiA family [Phycisphaerales bacterium]